MRYQQSICFFRLPAVIFLVLIGGSLSGIYAQTLKTKKTTVNVAGGVLDAGSTNFKTKTSVTPIGTKFLNGTNFNSRIGLFTVPFNQDPTDITLDNNTIDENQVIGTLVGTFTTLDPETNDVHTYTLVSGEGSDDNASFSILGDQLLSAEAFDFETKSTYTIRVRTDDGDGGGIEGIFEEVFSITINNLNDDPTAIRIDGNLTDSIDENLSSGQVIGLLTSTDQDIASDGDTHTYSLVAGTGDTDNASFSIVGDELHSSVTYDFETQINHSIRIRTTDSGGLTYEQVFTITVEDTNDDPTDITLTGSTFPSFQENDPAGTLIANMATTDVDIGTTLPGDNIDELHVYTLVAGSGSDDNNLFQINGSMVEVKDTLNFERAEGSDFHFRIRTTDLAGGFYEESFSISVTDIDDPPTGLAKSTYSIGEANTVGAVVGNLTPVDDDLEPNSNFQFVILPGQDGADFNINGNELTANSVFDFAEKSHYTITVRINDVVDLTGGSRPINTLYIDQVVEIFILAEGNNPPEEIFLDNTEFTDNLVQGNTIGTLTSFDPDAEDTFTYDLVGDASYPDNQFFAVSGVQLNVNVTLDIDVQSTFEINVQTNDGKGGIFSKSFILTMVPFNNTPPTDILLSGNMVTQNTAIASVIGIFSAEDIDGNEAFTYALTAGVGDVDNGSFSISGDQLNSNQPFDFNLQSSFSIRAEVTDNYGGTFAKIFEILVINNVPTDISLSSKTIVENRAVGTLIGNLSTTDPDGTDTHIYSLAEGPGDSGNPSFSISGDQLVSSVEFDTETKSSYSVLVRTDDGNGGTYEEAFTIAVEDENEAPMLAPVGNHNFDELTTRSFTVSASDVDLPGQNLVFSIDQDAVDQGMTLGSTSGDFSWTPSESQQGEYEVIFTVSDGTLSDSEAIIMTVNEVNLPPVMSAIENQIIDEEKEFTFTVTATDPDIPVQDLIFSLDGVSTGKGMIMDSVTGVFSWTPTESQDGSHNVTFTVSDGSLTDSKTAIILVNEVTQNAIPNDISLSGNEIEAFSEAGAVVGTLTTTDLDHVQHTYAIMEGEGFVISGSSLLSDQIFTNVADSTVSIIIETIDPLGASFSKTFTITILADISPPLISNVSNPGNIQAGGSAIRLSAIISDLGLKSVFYSQKKLTENEYTSMSLESSTHEFSIDLDPASLGDNGIKFYFSAMDVTGNESRSDINNLSLSFPADGINTPKIESIIRFGGEVEDYQLVSIPYVFSGSNARVDAIFDEYGGNPDKRNWRLIRFDNTIDDIVDLTGSYPIKLGEGYFFNAREAQEVKVGAARINDQDPFEITLRAGWNLIGNPYNVDLDWPMILANNGAEAVVNPLRTLDPSDPAAWPESTHLEAFGGAFVFAMEVTPLSLTYQDVASGRVVGYEPHHHTWFVPLTLEQHGNRGSGGVGMHRYARITLDRYDSPALPRWIRYLELGFTHQEHSQKLSSDIVPDKETYVWAFDVASDLAGRSILSWPEPGEEISNLKLLDEHTGNLIDMKAVESYPFDLENNRSFKILYSKDPDEQFTFDRILVPDIYPNPTTGSVTVPLHLPSEGAYDVEMRLLSLSGRTVYSVGMDLTGAFHEIILKPDEDVVSGLYFLEIRIEGDKVGVKRKQKLVIKR